MMMMMMMIFFALLLVSDKEVSSSDVWISWKSFFQAKIGKCRIFLTNFLSSSSLSFFCWTILDFFLLHYNYYYHYYYYKIMTTCYYFGMFSHSFFDDDDIILGIMCLWIFRPFFHLFYYICNLKLSKMFIISCACFTKSFCSSIFRIMIITRWFLCKNYQKEG